MTSSLALQARLQEALKPQSPIRKEPESYLVPLGGEFHDIPARISSFTEWDSVQAVQQAISNFEFGMMFSASLLADSIMRDDRVSGVMRTYVGGILGLPFTFEPAGGEKATAKAEKVAEIVGHEWPTMVPQSQLRRWILNGEMLGLGVGELIWKRTESRWTPTLKTHHNQFVIWDWGDRVYKFATMDGTVDLVPGDTHWALYTPGGYEYGWMTGLVRSIWMQWLVRQFTYRDWARYSEVHGLPIRGAIAPADVSPTEKSQYLRDIATCGAETAILLKQSKDGDKFDLKLIEALGRSEESFSKLIQHAEESIAIRILGQNLSTQIRGGSFAAAQVHETVRQDIKQAFAFSIQTDLKSQVVKPFTDFNFGSSQDLVPTGTWNTVPPADATAEANRLDVLATALVNFRAAGLAVDVKKFAEQNRIPLDPMYPDGRLPVELMDSNNGKNGGSQVTPRRVTPEPSKNP